MTMNYEYWRSLSPAAKRQWFQLSTQTEKFELINIINQHYYEELHKDTREGAEEEWL